MGVATFRLIVDEQVIFLDAYVDRVPAAPSVGLRAGEVDRADHVLIGHSHFDHLWGAERIAHNTGATVVGSHETVRLMQLEEVPEAQLNSSVRRRTDSTFGDCNCARVPQPTFLHLEPDWNARRGVFGGSRCYLSGAAIQIERTSGTAGQFRPTGNGRCRGSPPSLHPVAPS